VPRGLGEEEEEQETQAEEDKSSSGVEASEGSHTRDSSEESPRGAAFSCVQI